MCGVFVETCLRLDVYDVLDGAVSQSRPRNGALRWQTQDGEVVSAVGFQLQWPSPIQGELLLTYAEDSGTPDPIRLRIGLTRTRPGFGGHRWWFLCPVGDEDVHCERRVKMLFLPPLGLHFGCRTCHGLHYRSQYKPRRA